MATDDKDKGLVGGAADIVGGASKKREPSLNSPALPGSEECSSTRQWLRFYVATLRMAFFSVDVFVEVVEGGGVRTTRPCASSDLVWFVLPWRRELV